MPAAFVRTTGSAFASGTTTTLAVTVGTSPAIGSLLIVTARCGGGNVPTSISDGTANVYTRDAVSASSGTNVAIFSAQCVAVPSTITVTYGGSVANRTAYVDEFSGASLISSRKYNSVAGDNGATTAFGGSASSNLTLPLPRSLVVSVAGTSVTQTTWSTSSPSGLASPLFISGYTAARTYGIFAATTAQTHTWGWGSSGTWAVAAASYYATPMGAMFSTFSG